MASSNSLVRPHLLDESAILNAIIRTGLHPDDRGQIVDSLVDNYTVDLDLLAVVFASMLSKPAAAEESESLPRAA